MSLPVVITWKEKKTLIRGLGTAQLAYIVKNWTQKMAFAGQFNRINGEVAITAIAKELVSRKDAFPAAKHYAGLILSPNCACGGKGLYMHAGKTYCSACRPKAERKIRALKAVLEARHAVTSEAFDEKDKHMQNRLKWKKASRVAQNS